MHNSDVERRRGFKELIEAFLQERLEGKLKGAIKGEAEDDAEEQAEKVALLEAQYKAENWLANAARRVGQIQAVTHVLKATHPDAKGSSLYSIPDSSGREQLAGSHQLGSVSFSDIVGNAAALDVYKFLSCEYAGKTLLAWMQEEDADLLAALHSDLTIAQAWVKAFTNLIRQQESAASHTYAKQLYWLVGDDPTDDTHYHLLSPLFSSALAHTVHEVITQDRFGETVKETRQARRAGVYSDKMLREYPDLAVRKLGGTKPQNISQLNSERGGVNYLMASLPPLWRSRDVRPPLGTRPLFEQFGRRHDCAQLVKQLKVFLESDPAPTMETRQKRDNLLEQIISEMLQYADELRVLAPGWSTDKHCQLTDAETLWLDPGRAAHDAAFAQAWHQGHWKVEIRHRFATWLNNTLGERMSLGDIEHAFWADALNSEDWQRQIDADRRTMENKEASNVCNS